MPQGQPGTGKHYKHSDKARDKIRTSLLINRLEKFVLCEDEQGAKVELTPAQVTAALGLIKKTLPDMAAVAVDGKLDVDATVRGLNFKPHGS